MPTDLSSNSIELFLAFFIPGFVALKVYDLLIAGDRRDFSKSFYEVFAYSSLHYAVFYWPIVWANSGKFVTDYPVLHWLAMVILIALLPAIWPYLFWRVSESRVFSRMLRDPAATPWDRAFDRLQKGRRAVGVILHMKDGRRIAGVFASESRASTFPEPNQVYLESLCRLSESGGIAEVMTGSSGAIINGSEFSVLEFIGGKD